MAPADLLLVDDDAPTRRYFDLALRELGVTVRLCATLDDATQYLAHHSPSFVVSDLNFPDGTAVRLAQSVADLPAGARPVFVLMSGGLSPETVDNFRQLGVHHFWAKPVPLDQLCSLVQTWQGSQLPQTTQNQAIDRFFKGNQRLFSGYRNQTIAQLPHDVARAEAAWKLADTKAVCAVMHNLKTVLQLIGQPEEAEMALCIEQSLQQPSSPVVHAAWRGLRDRLIQLSTKGTFHG